MELLHYACGPVLNLMDREQLDPENDYAKPFGLWVSDGTAWRDWCVDEQFPCGQYVFQINLHEKAQILHLKTQEEIEAFARKYSTECVFSSMYNFHSGINWPRVADEYDGIIISPYCWPLRLKARWYYGWDVAGGCIWRVSQAIDDFKLIRVEEPRALGELEMEA